MNNFTSEVILYVMMVLIVPNVTAHGMKWSCSTDVNTTWPSTETLRNFGNTLSGREENFMMSSN